jgi:hypothetical protein
MSHSMLRDVAIALGLADPLEGVAEVLPGFALIFAGKLADEVLEDLAHLAAIHDQAFAGGLCPYPMAEAVLGAALDVRGHSLGGLIHDPLVKRQVENGNVLDGVADHFDGAGLAGACEGVDHYIVGGIADCAMMAACSAVGSGMGLLLV